MNQHIGSDFDDFLREEGIFAEVEAAAIKKVIEIHHRRDRGLQIFANWECIAQSR